MYRCTRAAGVLTTVGSSEGRCMCRRAARSCPDDCGDVRIMSRAVKTIVRCMRQGWCMCMTAAWAVVKEVAMTGQVARALTDRGLVQVQEAGSRGYKDHGGSGEMAGAGAGGPAGQKVLSKPRRRIRISRGVGWLQEGCERRAHELVLIGPPVIPFHFAKALQLPRPASPL